MRGVRVELTLPAWKAGILPLDQPRVLRDRHHILNRVSAITTTMVEIDRRNYFRPATLLTLYQHSVHSASGGNRTLVPRMASACDSTTLLTRELGAPDLNRDFVHPRHKCYQVTPAPID